MPGPITANLRTNMIKLRNPEAQSNKNFSPEFLNKIKGMLLDEQKKLKEELNAIAEKNPNVAGDFVSQFPEYGDKEDENAAEMTDYGNRLSLEDKLEKALVDVEKALKRLDDGTYGVCKYCQKTIEEKRLLARPSSNTHVECKKAITMES